MQRPFKPNSLSGQLLIFLGAALWSTNAPFFKILSVDPFLAIFIRALIAGIVLLPAVRLSRIKWNGWLLLMLISFVALCVGVVLAIRMTSANIASSMQYTAPLFLFLIALKKKEISFSWKELCPMILLLSGLAVSMCSKSDAVTWKGNLLALSSAFSFTAMTLSSKKAAADNPLGIVSISNLFCALVVFLFFLPADWSMQITAITSTEWFILAFLGVFQIGAGYAFYYLGLRMTEPRQAAMISPCEMILGPTWVAIFVHEYPDWIGIIGLALILLGVIGDILNHSEKNEARKSQGNIEAS